MNINLQEKIQVSVVITAHSEGTLLVPCLKSIFNAISIAEDHNIKSEVIIVCDSPTPDTISTINKLSERFSFKTVLTNWSNPGEARNSGIQQSIGKFIAIVDGDDLVSGNWILNSFLTAVDSALPAVFHPEIILSFGDRPSIFRMKSTFSGGISYLEIIENNLWASPVFGDKRIFEKIPYRNLRGNSGFGPEDWAWNLELMASGIQHGIAKRTFYLYRTSTNSGVNSTHSQSLLPFLNINELKKYFPRSLVDTGISNLDLSPNSKIRRIVTTNYYRFKWVFKPLVKMSPKFSRSIYLAARSIYAFFINRPVSSLTSFQIENKNPIVELSDEDFKSFSTDIALLTWIEPQASWPVVSYASLPVWDPQPTRYGEILENFCDYLSGEQDTILIFVPWVGVGGADLVSLNYARALKNKYTNSRVIIVTTLAKKYTTVNELPAGVELYSLSDEFQELDIQNRAKLLAQAIVESSPKIVLNVNSPDLFESLQKFSLPLSKRTNLYFCFFCFDKSIDGVAIHHAFESSRGYLENISGIFTDNDVVRNQLIEMFALDEKLVTTHHAPFEFLGSKSTDFTKSSNVNNGVLKLLWAHRLDRQKRPDVLNSIVSALRDDGITIEIDVFGKNLLTQGMSAEFDSCINTHGEFNGGLYGIDTSGYDGFLVTSEWEGLPTVLLQAVDLGLPIIATDVGGIRDVVNNDYSGYLISGPDDINGFVAAIKQLLLEPEQAEKMAIQAKTIISSQHTWDKFQFAVDQDLEAFIPVAGIG